MMLAASPAVAERIHESRDAFILKQVLFLTIAAFLVFGLSLLSARGCGGCRLGCSGSPWC